MKWGASQASRLECTSVSSRSSTSVLLLLALVCEHVAGKVVSGISGSAVLSADWPVLVLEVVVRLSHTFPDTCEQATTTVKDVKPTACNVCHCSRGLTQEHDEEKCQMEADTM